MPDLPILLLWGITGAAALWDIASRRIPNFLVGPGIAAGVFFSAQSGGLAGVGWSILGTAVPFILLAPIWAASGKKFIGAGDIKLYMCVGAFLGWKAVLLIILYAHLFKGVVAMCQLGIHKVRQRSSETALAFPTTPAALPILLATLLQTGMPPLIL
jgi:prepilin peptidase CpaA